MSLSLCECFSSFLTYWQSRKTNKTFMCLQVLSFAILLTKMLINRSSQVKLLCVETEKTATAVKILPILGLAFFQWDVKTSILSCFLVV